MRRGGFYVVGCILLQHASESVGTGHDGLSLLPGDRGATDAAEVLHNRADIQAAA